MPEISKRQKSRRSKRDELKDEIIADIERRIEEIQSSFAERSRRNNIDNEMIGILRDQIVTINNFCEKKGVG